jgi:pimeloyl-ACP methyl ester carboxylesterase
VPNDDTEVRLRIHGSVEKAAIVYLPGLHGDWTLIGGFRKALAGRARLIEITYPRTLSWSLEDYAEEIEKALLKAGVSTSWVLAESFGSQVLWPLLSRKQFRAQGVILAGGFGRHPARWAVSFAERLTGGISLTLLTRILFGYARVARWRFRKEPEVLAGIKEFIERRTELDRRAAKHRLHLIAENDPCALAGKAAVPIYGISGVFDPIVPWFWARGWLRKNCPQLQDYKILPGADHNVLSTASRKAAEQILVWMQTGA